MFGIHFLVILALSTAALAQEQQGSYSLAGMAVNSRTGEPVKRAIVRIRRMGDDTDKAPRMRTDGMDAVTALPRAFSAFSDSGGMFRFEALPQGMYMVIAEKPGFVFQNDGLGMAKGIVKLTSSTENFKVVLSPLGVISGKIVDQNGQPIRNVSTIALKADIHDGIRRTETARTVSTDDRGMYRLWNLAPGKYFIKAAGKSGGTFLYAGDTPPRYISDEAFYPAYFGGAKTLDSAIPVEIDAATEAQADLSLTLEPAFKIRGSLGNFVPRRTVKFELLSGEEEVSASRVSVDGDTGRFEIQDVTPGTYVLHATQGETSAETSVSVNGADVERVALALAPGVDIKFKTEVVKVEQEDEKPGDHFCQPLLEPAGRHLDYRRYAAYGGRGESQLSGILPGRYAIRIQCFGGYARSAVSGSQDLLANPTLTVQPGVEPQPIEIAAISGGGSIKGTVSADKPLKSGESAVLLVPQFPDGTGPQVRMLFHAMSDAGSYQFGFDHLAPGAYIAYAFLNGTKLEYRNSEFLRNLAGGVTVQVESGTKEITITAVAQ